MCYIQVLNRRTTWNMAVVTALLLLCLLPGKTLGADDICSRGICQCNRDEDGNLVVNCNNGRLTGVPDRIPTDTHTLNLEYNTLTSVESNAFHTLADLRRLSIRHNTIHQISPAAFRNLHSLSSLDLDFNNLTEASQLAYRDLLTVEHIKLGYNKFGSIEWSTFDFAGNISEIKLDGNEYMQCDCEVKALRDWAERRDPPVSLTGAMCDGQNLEDVPDEDFGNCPEKEKQTCWSCDEEPSLEECYRNGLEETCDSTEDVCGMTVITRGESHLFTRGCQWREDCTEQMLDNFGQCKQAANYQSCQFCCSGDNCRSNNQLEGYSYTMVSTLGFVLQRDYNPEYEDSTSSAYKTLSAEINSKISPIIEDVGEKSYMGVLRYRKNGSYVHVSSKITSRIPMATDYVMIQQSLYNEISRNTMTGSLALEIDLYSISVNGQTTCSAQRLSTDKGEFLWATTRVNYTNTVPCPVPKIGSDNPVAIRHCVENENGTAVWEIAEAEECAEENDRTRELKDLVNTPLSQVNIREVARKLANLTSAVQEMTEEEIEYSVQVIDKIVWSGNVTLTPGITGDVVSYYGNMMDVSYDVLANLEQERESTSRILRSIDHLSEVIDLDGKSDITLVEKPIAMSFAAVNSACTGAIFYTSPGEDGDLNTKNVRVRVNSTSSGSGTREASLTLPAAAFSALLPKQTNLHFVVYEDPKFFQVLEDTKPNNITHRYRRSAINETKFGKKMNTKIISAELQRQRLDNLEKPVVIHLKHMDKEYGADPSCVFWDHDLYGGDAAGGWSPAGCYMAEQVRGEYTVCHCNHLTSFAAIMDIYGNSGAIDEANRRALSIISYVGCGISLAALLATIITYSMFRKLRADNPSKILMNLCCAIIGLLVMFIISSQPPVRDSGAGCQAVAGILHYFLLSTWMWMAVEAFYMYLALVKVFKTYYSKFLLKCSLVGWGVPILIVLITVAISRENYGLQGEICWLSRNAFFGAALAPIALILVLNFIAFGLVIHQLRTLNSQKLEKSKSIRMDFQAQLRGAFSVVVLLGLTWIFAAFAIGQANLVFQYLFTILNSLQGLFIFIFYCVLKKDVAKLWRKKITGQLSSSHPTSSKGYTTSSTPMSAANYRYKSTTDSPYPQPKSMHQGNTTNDETLKTRL